MFRELTPEIFNGAFTNTDFAGPLWYVRGQIDGQPTFLVTNGSHHKTFADFLAEVRTKGIVEADHGTIELVGPFVKPITRLPVLETNIFNLLAIRRQNRQIEETERVVEEIHQAARRSTSAPEPIEGIPTTREYLDTH